jgi:hypothetical protein
MPFQPKEAVMQNRSQELNEIMIEVLDFFQREGIQEPISDPNRYSPEKQEAILQEPERFLNKDRLLTLLAKL